MKNLFFKNLDRLIIKDFWKVKIWPYFHKSIWIEIFVYFSTFLSQKHFFESFTWVIIHMDLVGFFLRLPNLIMTSITLNLSFHIDLGRFVGDSTCIIQIIR